MNFEELFQKIKPHYGRAIDVLRLEYLSAAPERRREIEETVTLLAAMVLGMSLGEERILLKPPAEEIIGEGTFLIGKVILWQDDCLVDQVVQADDLAI